MLSNVLRDFRFSQILNQRRLEDAVGCMGTAADFKSADNVDTNVRKLKATVLKATVLIRIAEAFGIYTAEHWLGVSEFKGLETISYHGFVKRTDIMRHCITTTVGYITIADEFFEVHLCNIVIHEL